MASYQVTKPVFPPEIWPPVFSHFRKHDDLVHLWTDCRHVCRQFKDDVEHFFRIKQLTKTTITFDCGMWYNPEAFGGKVNLRSISFTSDHLANDGQTAVFKIEDCAEEYMSEIMRRVSYCIATSEIERPGHLVCFRDGVNDTELPDLAIDEASREISFDWRAMFSQYFAEDKLKNYYMKINLFGGSSGMSEAQELKDKVDRGEVDMLHSMEAAMKIYGRAFDESKKSARRARIRRQWEAEGQECVFDEEFKREERAALATLKEVEFANGFLEFSDDEVGEEAESGSRRNEGTGDEEDEDDGEDEENEDGHDDGDEDGEQSDEDAGSEDHHEY